MSNNLLRQGKDSKVDDRSNWGSLKDVHNAIHDLTGGHMGNPQVSAFDPIFWLREYLPKDFGPLLIKLRSYVSFLTNDKQI